MSQSRLTLKIKKNIVLLSSMIFETVLRSTIHIDINTINHMLA